MVIKTRDFGDMEISEDGIVKFVEPILGFETHTDFVLLYDDEMGEVFTWVQSIDDSEICFIAVAPTLIDAEYSPVLPKSARKALCLANGEEPIYLVITVITPCLADATANLKSPIAINPKNNKAMQVVLDEDYPVRALLLQPEEDAKC
ncbi:MAG: flagellar assembly protein FliW [Oscillospiraceae bacterium]